MNELVIRNGVKINGSLSSGTGDPLLGRNATSGAITLAASPLSTALNSGQILIGNNLNIATPVTPTGDIIISNTGTTAISAGVIINSDINSSAAISVSKLAALTASKALVTDGSGFISASSVTSTELGYLSGVTSALQTQLNAKQATITGGATTIVSSNLTASKALVSDSNGKVAVSSVTSTELGYISGVTSAIQTQLDSKLQVTLSSAADGDILKRVGGVWVNYGVGTNGQVLTISGGTPVWGSPTANGIPTGGSANQYLRKIDGTDYNTTWDTLTLSKITDVTASAADVNILTGTTITSTELGYLSGTSTNIQAQLNNKMSATLPQNAIFVGNSSNIAAAYAAGSDGQVLQVVGGVPVWQTISGTGSVTSIDVSGGTTGLSFSGGPISTSGTITMSGTLSVSNGGTGVTSITSGRIPYGKGTSAVGVGPYWDNTNGRLGIGGSPNFVLDAFGSSVSEVTIGVTNTSSGEARLNIIRTGTTPTTWITYIPTGSTDLRFFNSGDRLSITNGGTLKIFATPSTDNTATPLSIDGSGNVTKRTDLISGSGSANRLAIWSGSNTQTSDVDLGYNTSTNVLSNSNGQYLTTNTTTNAFTSVLPGQIQIDSNGNGDHVSITETAINPPTGSSINFSDLQKLTTVSSYTPTLVNGTNVDNSLAYTAFYSRLGDQVTIRGAVSIDVTAANTSTTLFMSIPISSNFITSTDASGIAFCGDIFGYGASIYADFTNDRLVFVFVSASTGTAGLQFFTYTATYKVM